MLCCLKDGGERNEKFFFFFLVLRIVEFCECVLPADSLSLKH